MDRKAVRFLMSHFSSANKIFSNSLQSIEWYFGLKIGAIISTIKWKLSLKCLCMQFFERHNGDSDGDTGEACNLIWC